MRKGYYGDAVQTPGEEMSAPVEVATADFSENKELIATAQSEGGESLEAMAATERLMYLNRGLVKKIALRFCERGVELDDLMQIGSIGMIKAIRSFDLSRGTCFSTYAVPLIFGEIRRHLRDEGPIKVSRQYKRLSAHLMEHKNRIMLEEGREPHICELAMLCGVSPEEAAVALDATAPLASLSDLVCGEDEGRDLEDTLADNDTVAEMESFIDKISLSQAISTLSPEHKKIITLRYYRNMTQQQVAAHMGVTQVKVSREEKKIIEQLRRHLVGEPR